MSRNYSEFVEQKSLSCADKGPECRAYRLGSAPQLSTEALTRDGQYAPIKVRSAHTIALTGVNFEARIGLDSNAASSSLGVALEHEFAQSDVVENFLRVYTAHHALLHNGVILHSAGLVFDDLAYVFVGRSGAGKTTLTRKAYQEGARVLSDDVNLLLPRKGRFCVFAVPFAGEFGRVVSQPGGRSCYPVAGVVLLEHGDCLSTRKVRASEAVARLLVGCPFVNTGTDESAALFDVLTTLVNTVPVICLQSRRDDTVEGIMRAVREGFGLDDGDELH
jgi:hypothetical protein